MMEPRDPSDNYWLDFNPPTAFSLSEALRWAFIGGASLSSMGAGIFALIRWGLIL